MAATARTADRLLVEASWNRWHPRTRRAEALLRSGAIGAVRRVEAGFTFAGVAEDNYRLDPARGGGALYDVGCYATAAALWATGFTALQAVGASRRLSPTGVDLTTEAVLSFGSAEAFVRGSIDEDGGQWLRVEGDRGTLVLDGNAAFTSWLTPSTLTVTTAAATRVEHFAPVDPYRVMVEHVSAAIRGVPRRVGAPARRVGAHRRGPRPHPRRVGSPGVSARTSRAGPRRPPRARGRPSPRRSRRRRR